MPIKKEINSLLEDIRTEEARDKFAIVKKFGPWMIVALVVVVVGVFATLQFTKANKLDRQLSDLKNNPSKIAEDQTKELVGKISQLIVLPTDEQPTVATVSDLAPLANQPFFANAQLGFKVLIYTQSKKAVLYDPVAHKIVEVAPINIGENTANTNSQVAGATTNVDKSKVVIQVLNASNKAGLASQVASSLKQAGFVNVSVGDATSGSSAQTIITYNPKDNAQLSEIQQVLKNKGVLQERASATNITITLGTDFSAE